MNASNMQMPQTNTRTCRNALTYILDIAAENMMGDTRAYAHSDVHSLRNKLGLGAQAVTATTTTASRDIELPVKHEFYTKSKSMEMIRRIWLVVTILGMFTWLVVDITRTELDGLVPGLRDSYVISAAPVNGGLTRNEVLEMCTCSFRPDIAVGSDSASYAQQGPYSKLVAAKHTSEVLGASLFLSYCNKTLLPRNTPEGRYLAAQIHELFYKLYDMRLTAPTTPIKLSQQTWRAARFFQAHRYAVDALTTAHARIRTAPALPNYQFAQSDVATATNLSDVLYVSFMQTLARLEGIPDHVVTAEQVTDDGRKKDIHCASLPSPDQSAIAMQNWCRQNASEIYDLDENCPDPYDAYVRWCAPVFCHNIKAKAGYLQAMQILAAMGGMYSLITLFVFTILWGLVRLAHRRSCKSAEVLHDDAHIEIDLISRPANEIEPGVLPSHADLITTDRQLSLSKDVLQTDSNVRDQNV